jgi:hypothetical protein
MVGRDCSSVGSVARLAVNLRLSYRLSKYAAVENAINGSRLRDDESVDYSRLASSILGGGRCLVGWR